MTLLNESVVDFQRLLYKRYKAIGKDVVSVSAQELTDLLNAAIKRGIGPLLSVGGTVAHLDYIDFEKGEVRMYGAGSCDDSFGNFRIKPNKAFVVIDTDMRHSFAALCSTRRSERIELSDSRGTEYVDGRQGILFFPSDSLLMSEHQRISSRSYLGLHNPGVDYSPWHPEP